MKIYSRFDGYILRVLKTKAQEAQHGAPSSYGYMLELDPETNQEIVQYIDTDFNNTTVINGIVYYQENPVTINPPGDAWEQALVQDGAEAQAGNIPNWATWTEAQALAWLQTNVVDILDAVPDIEGLTPTAWTNNSQNIVGQFQDVITTQTTVIISLARMIIALRNKSFPGLEVE